MPFAILALVALMTSCASRPVSTAEAEFIGPEKMFSNAFSDPRSDGFTLIVKRDRGFIGAACDTRIHVDGTLVAKIGPGEAVELIVPAGRHIVSAVPPMPCAGTPVEHEVTAAPLEVRTYRISMDHNGSVALQPTAF